MMPTARDPAASNGRFHKRASYPKREPYFAHRFCRLLTKSTAAQELGPETCWLLTIIAHLEDAKRYSKPVTFYNEQLMPLCGFGGRSRLVCAREKAVRAGWLHYDAGGKGTPGNYWVMIPPEYANMPDGACDENPSEYRSEVAESRPDSGRQIPVAVSKQDGKSEMPSRFGTQFRTATGRQPDGKPAPSYPSPIPSPKESPSADADPPSEIISAWNELPEVPKVRTLTASRRKKIAARLSEPDWKRNWRAGIQGVRDSEFLRGKNDRGWKADIDWFIRPDSLTRILEGKYASNGKANGTFSKVWPVAAAFHPQHRADFKAALETLAEDLRQAGNRIGWQRLQDAGEQRARQIWETEFVQ